MSEQPSVVSTDHIFKGRIISVRVDTLQEPSGSTYTREIISYGTAVVLVPVAPDGRLLMVRQYRHAVGRWMLELPAGGVDERDASAEEAALRELREETGYRGTLEHLGGFFLAPGYSDEYQHIFAATDLAEDPLDADEDEHLTLERVALEDALRLVSAGEICDAKSVAALFLYLRGVGRA